MAYQMQMSPSASGGGMGNVQPQPSYYVQGAPIPVAGTMSPYNPSVVGFDKAKVCCNCCNCTHQACGVFWAIFNLVQLIASYGILTLRLVNAEEIHTAIKEQQEKYEHVPEAAECAEQLRVTGTPTVDAKLYCEIIFLVIYTIGSVFFSFAVFYKRLAPPKRALCLLIYLSTIACLPLAYFIPLIIDTINCFDFTLGLLVVFGWWYIIILVTTGFAVNIAFVFRNWILRNPVDGMPSPSQQQSQLVLMGGGEGSNDPGKEITDDINATKAEEA